MTRLSPAAAQRLGLVLLVLVVLPVTLLVRGQTAGMPRYSDEGHHLRQITAFCAGDFTLDPKLTTIPGYHAVSAAAGRLLGDCSLRAMRGVNVALGLLSVAAFYWAALAAGVERPALRTLQYYFLPILLPYHFLVYSDSASLLAVLVAVGLVLRGHRGAAALVGALAILLRQTNVVWLAFLAAHVLVEDDAWTRAKSPWRAAVREVAPFLAGVAAFGAFVLANGGVALGDARAHHPGLYPGNVLFLLLMMFALFLPRNVSLLRSGRERLQSPVLAAILALVLVGCVTSLGVSHAYNRFPGFLRNDLLLAFEERPLLRLAAFVPVGGALAAVWVDRLRRGAFHLLYPAALLSLVPSKLVDHRYALVPLALYLLFRREDSVQVEGATLALWVLLSAVLLDGVARGQFAL